MGVQLISQTANYEDVATSLVIPVMTGLIGAYVFKSTNAGRNLVNGGVVAETVGTQTQKSTYGQSASANAYIDSKIDLNSMGEYTLVAVCDKPTTLSSGYATNILGTYESYLSNGSRSAGRGIFFSGSVLYSQFVYYSDANVIASAPLSLPVVDMSNRGVYAARIQKLSATSVRNTLNNLTSGASRTIAATNVFTTNVGTGSTMKITHEADVSTNTQTYSSAAYVALIYNRALTDAELQEVHLWINKYCSDRGITLG